MHRKDRRKLLALRLLLHDPCLHDAKLNVSKTRITRVIAPQSDPLSAGKAGVRTARQALGIAWIRGCQRKLPTLGTGKGPC